MDSNKDEADRCLELAEQFIAEGKCDKAEKFIQKAQKLFPTKKAEGTSHTYVVFHSYYYPLVSQLKSIFINESRIFLSFLTKTQHFLDFLIFCSIIIYDQNGREVLSRSFITSFIIRSVIHFVGLQIDFPIR